MWVVSQFNFKLTFYIAEVADKAIEAHHRPVSIGLWSS